MNRCSSYLLSNKISLQNTSPIEIFSCENCEIFKNSFFSRTPPVVAFGNSIMKRVISVRSKNLQHSDTSEIPPSMEKTQLDPIY